MNNDKSDHDENTTKAAPRKMVGREELFDVFKSDGNAELFAKPTQRKNSTTQNTKTGPTIPHQMVDAHGPSMTHSVSDATGPSESAPPKHHQMNDAAGPSTTHQFTDEHGPTIQHPLNDATGSSTTRHLSDAIGPTIHHRIGDSSGPSTTHHVADVKGPTIHHSFNDASGASMTHPFADANGPITVNHIAPDATGPTLTHHWVDAKGPSIEHHMQDAVGPVVPRTLENVIVKPPIIQRLFSLFTVGKKTEPARPPDSERSTEQSVHLDSMSVTMEDRIAKVMSAQKETLEKMKTLESDSQEIGSTTHSHTKSKGH